MKRFLTRVAFAVLALALFAALAAVGFVRRQLPGDDAPPIAGLGAPVHVDLDARAIPTVHAASIVDAMRAQGYLVARERMFQLEMQRRFATGTLSEIVGEGALAIDRLHRTYGFRQVAEAAVPLLPADQRAGLEAYAAGINAFLESHPKRWGIELQMLGITPRAWTPADSLCVLLLMYEDLTSSWQDELRVEQIARLPPAEQRFLMPQITAEDILLIPDADPKPAPDAPAFFQATHALLAPAPALLPLGELPPWAGARTRGVGSNNWALGPSRTKSGKAMLANDPHLDLNAPGIWYAIRIELPSRWVQGVTLAGLPGIVIGQNDRLAWGFTNLGTDIQDLYREAKVAERVESIAVKGGAPVELRVAIGKHGPQVVPGRSLVWAALDPKNLRLPLEGMMTATDWATFNAAVDEYFGPAQNVVYADIDGHFGWRASGLVPIRREGDDGAHIHDGADPDADWRGFVPMASMPRVLDPPEGYVVTANQRVIGSSFPHVITTDWAAPNRARRIVERIESSGKIDRDVVESIQLDVVSPFHREMMAELVRLVPDLSRFEKWDGAADAGGPLFLEARAWEAALHDGLVARVLGGARFEWSNDHTTLVSLLRADDAAWARAGLGDRAAFLRDADVRHKAWLDAHAAKTWGEENTLRIQHPIGRAGGVLAWLFNPPTTPQSGGGDTVRAAGHGFGQSMRLIVDWGAPHDTTLVLPLGQSGHLGSPYRLDQRTWWLHGDPGGSHTRLEQPEAHESGDSLLFSPAP